MKKYIILIISAILIIYVGYTNTRTKIWEYNANKFKDNLTYIEDNSVVNLNDITPFEWDKVYFFSPYTPDDYIYSTIGYKFGKIRFIYDESANQAIFLHNKKVVCYLNGFSYKVGYYFRLNRYSYNIDEAHLTLYNDEPNKFKITNDKNIVNISYINNVIK